MFSSTSRSVFLVLSLLLAGHFAEENPTLHSAQAEAVADAEAEAVADAEALAATAAEAAEAAATAAVAASEAAMLALAKAKAAKALAVEKARLAANLHNAGSAAAPFIPKIHTVPLQKQLVPVRKNGRLVANKTAFFGQIHIGSPQQAFTVVFDTGSGHLILPSTACESTTCRQHMRYNRSASESAVDIEANGKQIQSTAVERDQVQIAFGTGEVLGEFVEEKVCLGSDAQRCMNMRVVVATQMSSEPFETFAFDGVLGIGLSSLALNSPFSFFGEMTAQHPTMLPYFAFYLSRNQADDESSISFGGFDPKRATSEIQWAPVDKEELGYWQVKLKSVRVGDVELDMCADGECRAILDTGTSLLGVPRQATRSLSRQLARLAPPGSGSSCLDTPGAMLSFDLGDMVVNLGAEDYSQSAPVSVTVPGQDPRLVCKSLLMPVDAQGPLGSKVFIWGEPVLRKYYTVYDLGQKRVGFTVAQQTVPTSPDTGITI